MATERPSYHSQHSCTRGRCKPTYGSRPIADDTWSASLRLEGALWRPGKVSSPPLKSLARLPVCQGFCKKIAAPEANNGGFG